MKTLIAACEGVIESSEFGAAVVIEALVPVDNTPALIKRTLDLSAGDVEAVVLDTVFRGARIR